MWFSLRLSSLGTRHMLLSARFPVSSFPSFFRFLNADHGRQNKSE